MDALEWGQIRGLHSRLTRESIPINKTVEYCSQIFDLQRACDELARGLAVAGIDYKDIAAQALMKVRGVTEWLQVAEEANRQEGERSGE